MTTTPVKVQQYREYINPRGADAIVFAQDGAGLWMKSTEVLPLLAELEELRAYKATVEKNAHNISAISREGGNTFIKFYAGNRSTKSTKSYGPDLASAIRNAKRSNPCHPLTPSPPA